MKKVLKIILYVIVGMFLLGIAGGLLGSIGMGEIKKLSINDVDLSRVADGVYAGEYHKGRWNAEVEVTVKDHRLTAIRSTAKQTDPMSSKIAKEGAKAMIARQSLVIDAVSGASVNTKAFQKAVENALAGRAGR